MVARPAPDAASSAARRTWKPRPSEALKESTISIETVPPTASRASVADWRVPLSLDEMRTATIASWSTARRRNVSSNRPADGWDVVGSCGDRCRRSMNSSVLMSIWSRKTSAPTWTLSGTIVMWCACRSSGLRSEVLSVTTAIRAICSTFPSRAPSPARLTLTPGSVADATRRRSGSAHVVDRPHRPGRQARRS